MRCKRSGSGCKRLKQKSMELNTVFLQLYTHGFHHQNLLDGPSRSFAYPGTIIENFSLGRASLNAIIPKTTSAIRASAKVLGYLNDKFQSLSFRVPTSIVSTADITVKLDSDADKKEIIDLFKKKNKNKLEIFF